jgi:hypothetical protein
MPTLASFRVLVELETEYNSHRRTDIDGDFARRVESTDPDFGSVCQNDRRRHSQRLRHYITTPDVSAHIESASSTSY